MLRNSVLSLNSFHNSNYDVRIVVQVYVYSFESRRFVRNQCAPTIWRHESSKYGPILWRKEGRHITSVNFDGHSTVQLLRVYDNITIMSKHSLEFIFIFLFFVHFHKSRTLRFKNVRQYRSILFARFFPLFSSWKRNLKPSATRFFFSYKHFDNFYYGHFYWNSTKQVKTVK